MSHHGVCSEVQCRLFAGFNIDKECVCILNNCKPMSLIPRARGRVSLHNGTPEDVDCTTYGLDSGGEGESAEICEGLL